MLLSADAFASDPTQLPLVLLVEDHQDTRQMYAEFLSITFDVMTAVDGSEALDLMRARRPELLITDLSLPGVDGYELVRLMRADSRLRTVPVICLSGYGGHVHEQRAKEAGCDRILEKPCMPDTLADIAADVLHAYRDRRTES
jgi:two-component system cell cycle response regulator DivK